MAPSPRRAHLLHDATTVQHVRREVGPAANRVVATLLEDPLGDEPALRALHELLTSPRAVEARAARDRVLAGLPPAWQREATRQGGRSLVLLRTDEAGDPTPSAS